MASKEFDKILEAPPEEIERELVELRTELDNEIPKKSVDKSLLIATWNIRSFLPKNRNNLISQNHFFSPQSWS